MVKEFLSQKGIKFLDKDVSLDQQAAREMVNKTKQMGVPVTLINNEVIIGFDRPRLEQALARYQQSARPSFGASIADAGRITAGQGSAVTQGAYIGKVRPGSVAERLGLRGGDIILELNKQNISNASELENAISKLAEGSRIWVVFLRANQKMSSEGLLQS